VDWSAEPPGGAIEVAGRNRSNTFDGALEALRGGAQDGGALASEGTTVAEVAGGMMHAAGGPAGIGLFALSSAAEVIQQLGPQADLQRQAVGLGGTLNPDGTMQGSALALGGLPPVVIEVHDEAGLAAAMRQANGGGNFIISLGADIALTGDLPALDSQAGGTSIAGKGHTLEAPDSGTGW
jgi:hypothetical protein